MTSFPSWVESAALIDLRPYATSVVVSGGDADDYLQRMLSSDLRGLDEGAGRPATLLSPKGKMIAAFDVFREPDDDRSYRLVVDPSASAALVANLERMVILEDVRIQTRSELGPFISIQGPRATDLLAGWLPGSVSLVRRTVVPGERSRGGIRFTRTPRSSAGGWDVFATRDETEQLSSSLREAGAILVGPEEAESLRIDGGYPRFGVDADDTRLPPESGYDDAVSTSKGCYVGQEIVARLRTYGHVNWLLRRLTVPSRVGPIPIGTPIVSEEGKRVGTITSDARALDGRGRVALGYLRFEIVRDGGEDSELSIEWGDERHRLRFRSLGA